jgi:D-3-phosphoglycerate dehydrogenase
MFKIELMNEIAQAGLDQFNHKAVFVKQDSDAILLRSASLHTTNFPDTLLAIARAGIGVNNIPINQCSDKGIVVFNTPGANANAVKELAIAGLLLSSRDIVGGINWVNQLTESKDELTSLVEAKKSNFTGPELKGKTLGVVGLGSVGVLLANAAIALGMKVLGYDPYISIHSAWGLSSSVLRANSFDELFSESDYISLHVPLIDETKHLINKKSISKMKKGVKVLNFARAELVDDHAMKDALALHKVAKYVTDFPNDATKTMVNTIQIPHLGASTPESEVNCAVMAAQTLLDYLENGSINNSVNFPNCTLSACHSVSRITLLHKNVVNMVSQITSIIGHHQLNIETMQNVSRNQWAYTVLDVDNVVDDFTLSQLALIEDVVKVRRIRGNQ